MESIRRSALALLIASFLGASGCATMAGALIGSQIEKEHHVKPRLATARAAHSLKAGQWLRVQMRSGRTLEGAFGALVPRARDEYAAAYAAVADTRPDGVQLPPLGPVVWRRPDSRAHPAELVGFQPNGAVLFSDRQTFVVRYEDVAELSATDRAASGEKLQRLADAGRIPLLATITFLNVAERIALEDVDRLATRGKRRGAERGALVGALLDALALLWYVSWEPNFAPTLPPPSYR